MTAPLTPENWPAVSALLDEALALPVEERDTWLQSLEGERAAFRDTLRELLSRASGVETDEFLATLPRLTRVAERGPLTELAAGDAIGPYRLLSELGTGGMGAVWLAERSDGTLKRKVALKLPRLVWARGLAERMARERDILASLEHPHIARLYDAGVDQHGRPYLALEYVEGQPIDVYAKDCNLTVRQKLDLLLQVCGAVAFAHSRLVVHRDLKPSNILVTADGQVRLLDFGIAKLMEGDSAKETQLTQLSGRALTLDYASPEQIKGEPIGTASDVYSLGVVAYELLTGAKPYKLKRGSAAELEEAIANADPQKASDAVAELQAKRALKGDIDAILNKALRKDNTRRYLSIDAFADDLRRHLLSQPVLARPDTWRYRAGKVLLRYRWPVASATVALITVMAAAIAALHQAHIAAGERDRVRLALETNAQVQEFVTSLFAVPNPPDVKYVDQGLERVRAERGKVNDAVRARMLLALANLYSSIARDEQARKIYDESAELALLARDYETAAEALALLALNQTNYAFDHEAARRTAARGLQLAEEHLPEDARRIGRLSSAMTVALTNLRQYDDALMFAERAVRLHEAADGADHVRTLAARGDVARLFHHSGRHSIAETEYRRLLPDMVRDLGEADPNHLMVLENFGGLLSTMNKFEESESVLQDALAIRAARFGPDHPSAASAYSILGRTFARAGKPLEAASAFERSLTVERKANASPSAFQLYMCSMLAAMALDAGRYAEAERWRGLGDEFASHGGRDIAKIWIGYQADYFNRLVIAGRIPTDSDVAKLRASLTELPRGSDAALTLAMLDALVAGRSQRLSAMQKLRALESDLTDKTSPRVRSSLLLSQARTVRSLGDTAAASRLYARVLDQPMSSQRCQPHFLTAGLEWTEVLAELGQGVDRARVLDYFASCASVLPADAPPRTALLAKLKS